MKDKDLGEYFPEHRGSEGHWTVNSLIDTEELAKREDSVMLAASQGDVLSTREFCRGLRRAARHNVKVARFVYERENHLADISAKALEDRRHMMPQELAVRIESEIEKVRKEAGILINSAIAYRRNYLKDFLQEAVSLAGDRARGLGLGQYVAA